MKRFFLAISFLLLAIFTGYSALNPLNPKMFNYHDDTQAVRIQQFVLNLKSFKIPPRIAPDFSHQLGFPVFNYYAPTPYWITSLFNLIGLSIINSIKISFLLAILLAFFFMFKFLSLYFGFYQSLLGGLIYASSPWIAIEIFIRGNLAEAWLIAFLPLAFYMVKKNSQSSSKSLFFLTVLSIALSLTSHNVLSIVLLVFLFVFIVFNKKPIRNILALISSFLLNGYYFIPAVFEMSKTHAVTVAKTVSYIDNLLCPWQLWTTPFWGYGASVPGCIDGMPFMLGKPQILLAAIGLIYIVFIYLKNKKFQKKDFFIILFILLLSTFLTTTLSTAASKILEPALSFFQFPWRFLTFSLFGLAFMTGGILLPRKYRKYEYILAIIGLFVVFYNSKFFKKYLIDNKIYQKKYISSYFIEKQAAYKVAEYLPITVDYENWRQYEPKDNSEFKKETTLEDHKFIHSLIGQNIKIINQKPFLKEAVVGPDDVIINISYLPYWKIYLDSKEYYPSNIDKFGRPIISLNKPTNITIKYKQTLLENIANIISIISLILLIVYVFSSEKIKFNKQYFIKLFKRKVYYG